MNILWIEDFGSLPAGRNILNQLFGNLLSFDNWDNDVLSLITKPTDLNEFCTQQKSLHTIYLCRNYFDYAEFKQQHNIINEIDVMILDIRLDDGNHVDFSLPIPEPYEDKTVFHENGGFYIFNDLVHLGVSAEKICFMTGEDSTFGEFQKKCVEIYMPKVNCFVKKPDNTDYEKLRVWLGNQASAYSNLRRGIIEGCRYLKTLSDDKLQFNQFIETKKKRINSSDASDYLNILENFLPLREPDDKAALYKLFIRTLAHEWEAATPKALKDSKVFLAFSWIMKMTRNWSAHGSTFANLTEQDVAYLFMINMRAMFDLSNTVLAYEQQLFNLFKNLLEIEELKNKIGTNANTRTIPLEQEYAATLKKGDDTEAVSFHYVLNQLKSSQVNPSFFIKGLYQTFWFLSSSGSVKAQQNPLTIHYQFNYFDYQKDNNDAFVFQLARHIYPRSFTN
ncbi:MAG: hypothetical protein WAX77_12870 [Methylococcaceae bacterium]